MAELPSSHEQDSSAQAPAVDTPVAQAAAQHSATRPVSRWPTWARAGRKVFATAAVLAGLGALLAGVARLSGSALLQLRDTAAAVNQQQPCSASQDVAPEMVLVSGGVFLMGSPADEAEREPEEVQHEVRIAPFAIGRCEVTFADYDRYAQAQGLAQPSDEGWGRGRRPVINVSWDEATAYAQWLSKQTGQAYRLPTEAEWEYAARAGTTTAFSSGATLSPQDANYDSTVAYNGGKTGEYRKQTIEVGSFPANAFGLYDVHGNVWEWTCSTYDDKYAGGEQRCVTGSGGGRVLRGGSWSHNPRRLRSANRYFHGTGDRGNDVGFRLARAIRSDLDPLPLKASPQARPREAQAALPADSKNRSSTKKK